MALIGHSERRHIIGENNVLAAKKLAKAVQSGLTGVLCVGEKLEEREKGLTEQTIKTQVVEGLKHISDGEMENIVLAYEPVWAIGTGKTATPEMAQKVHSFIRGIIAEKYHASTAEETRILYGGSVKPDNIKGLMKEPDIDGALVGGASLDAQSFVNIARFNEG